MTSRAKFRLMIALLHSVHPFLDAKPSREATRKFQSTGTKIEGHDFQG